MFGSIVSKYQGSNGLGVLIDQCIIELKKDEVLKKQLIEQYSKNNYVIFCEDLETNKVVHRIILPYGNITPLTGFLLSNIIGDLFVINNKQDWDYFFQNQNIGITVVDSVYKYFIIKDKSFTTELPDMDLLLTILIGNQIYNIIVDIINNIVFDGSIQRPDELKRSLLDIATYLFFTIMGLYFIAQAIPDQPSTLDKSLKRDQSIILFPFKGQ